MVTRSLDGWARITLPGQWATAPFRGEPATVYFPLVFLSSGTLSGPCFRPGYHVRCDTQHWFPADATTPRSGVIVLWSHAEFPGSISTEFSSLPGRPTSVDHRPAKIWSGAAGDSCPVGSTSEIDAEVRTLAHRNPGDWLAMTACFGRTATPDVRRAAYAMLASLHVSPPRA